MTPNLFQIFVAAAMTALALFLVWRYVQYKRAGSDRRLAAMLVWAGVSPAVTAGESNAVMKNLRRRCRRCQKEGVCERWLAGELRGGNEFCPNAPTMAALAHGARTPRAG